MIYGATAGRARARTPHRPLFLFFPLFLTFFLFPFSSFFLRDEDGRRRERRWEENALYHALLFFSSLSVSPPLSVFITLSASSYLYHLMLQSWTA